MNKDMATEAIGMLKDENDASPAQIKEIQRLINVDGLLHCIPPDLKENAASQLISKLRANQRSTQGQRDALERRGTPAHKIPDTFVEASKMLDAMKTRRRRRDDNISAAFKESTRFANPHAFSTCEQSDDE